ncbi:hypothetical protein D3C75_1324660 [compost metagenome]
MTEHDRNHPALVLQEQFKRVAGLENPVCYCAPESPVLYGLVPEIDRVQLPGLLK